MKNIKYLELLELELPKDIHFNCYITSDYKYLISDSNNSSNWKTSKIPLPKGEWSIFKNRYGNKITLSK